MPRTVNGLSDSTPWSLEWVERITSNFIKVDCASPPSLLALSTSFLVSRPLTLLCRIGTFGQVLGSTVRQLQTPSPRNYVVLPVVLVVTGGTQQSDSHGKIADVQMWPTSTRFRCAPDLAKIQRGKRTSRTSGTTGRYYSTLLVVDFYLIVLSYQHRTSIWRARINGISGTCGIPSSWGQE